MKKACSEYAENHQITIKEILNKKQFYENRMLQEKEVTEHLISLCNQIHAELKEIYPVIDNLKKNENKSTIDLIGKFKHVELLFSNMYLIYIENDLNVQNLEYFRLEIEEDIIKLRQTTKTNGNIVPNSPNEDELSSLGSI